MPFPPTCQSPVTCDNRPSRRVGNTWLCLACFEYTERHNHLPIPEETMSEPIHDQIRAYVQKHGPTHMKQLSAALNIGMSSISSAATTLRREGVLMPAKGDGVIRLTPAPADPTLPDAVPGHPLLWQSPDRQGGAVCVRGTRVDVVTLWMCQPAYSGALNYGVTREQAQAAIDYVNAHPELQPPVPDEDTVQTSEADTLRAEVARLTTTIFDLKAEIQACEASNANCRETLRIWEQTHEHMKQKNEQLTAAYSGLEEENARIESHLKGELETALDEIVAMKHGPTVRLEWSPWQQDSGIWETYLRLKIGNIDVSIGRIVYQHRIYEAALHHSDRDGGTTTTITGTSLIDVGTVYIAAMQSAGLPVVSIPALPESA